MTTLRPTVFRPSWYRDDPGRVLYEGYGIGDAHYGAVWRYDFWPSDTFAWEVFQIAPHVHFIHTKNAPTVEAAREALAAFAARGEFDINHDCYYCHQPSKAIS